MFIKKFLKSVLTLVMLLVGAVVAAMFAVGEDCYHESDGDAVQLDLTATVKAKQVAYISQWLGITAGAGDSGDTIALDISLREYQFELPASFDPAVGDIVYITVASVTGHTPQDAAYTNSSGAGKKALFKVTGAKDANNVCTGILISKVS